MTKLALICALVLVTVVTAVPSCMNDEGHPVDWFIMIKLPKLSHTDYSAGTGYFYLDSEGKKFEVSRHRLTENSGAFYHTLSQAYNDQSLGVVMYNDEFPNGHTVGGNAHAKGVIMWDGASSSTPGVWFLHSIPRFPHKSDAGPYNFPDNEVIYGQSVFCTSLGHDSLSTVGAALLHNHANVYEAKLAANHNPDNMADVKAGNWAANTHLDVHTITTRGGERLTLFSKSVQWAKDLYEDGVAPHFNTNLAAETWMRPKMESTCAGVNGTFSVENAEYVHPPHGLPKYHYTKDHSKLALSTTPGMVLVCVGDINRNESQARRGGGTLCINDKDVWHEFYTVYGAHRDRC